MISTHLTTDALPPAAPDLDKSPASSPSEEKLLPGEQGKNSFSDVLKRTGMALQHDGQTFATAALSLSALDGDVSQNFEAAPAVDSGTPALPGQPELTSLALGPHLQVITSAQPAADAESLRAFARSQGLSEAAVQWLFGASAAGPEGLKPGLETSSGRTPPQLTGLAESATPVRPSAPGHAVRTAPMGAFATLQPGQAGIDVQNPAPVALAMGAALQASPGQGQQTLTQTSATAGTAELVQDWHPGPDASAAAWTHARGQRTLSDRTDAWLSPKTQAEDPSIPRLLSLDIRTLEFKEADASMQIDPSPDMLSQPANGDRVAAGIEVRPPATHPLQEKTSLGSSLIERNENIQDLADRVGKAIGERLKSEFDRGQWQLRLLLQPGRLGEVEIDMRLGHGGLEAQFVSAQASTRELLQDSLTRLRETLQQLGMNVASLQVGGEAARQRGGDPTPGHRNGRPDNGRPSGPEAPSQELTTAKIGSPGRTGQNGWDVVV